MERDAEPDRTRIRVGLAIVGLAFLISVVILLAVDDGLARTVMSVVAFTALVRAALLVRSLRRST